MRDYVTAGNIRDVLVTKITDMKQSIEKAKCMYGLAGEMRERIRIMTLLADM